MQEKPSVGTEVRYVLMQPNASEEALAVITFVEDTAKNHVNVMIFASRSDENPIRRVAHVPYDVGRSPGSWHWPED